MMLTMNSEISDYGSWETGSYVYEEDEFDDPENEDEDDDDDDDEDEYETDLDPQEDASDVHAHEDEQEDDGRNSDTEEAAYSDDEAYARALQEAEESQMAARLSALSGLADREYTYITITQLVFQWELQDGFWIILTNVIGCRG